MQRDSMEDKFNFCISYTLLESEQPRQRERNQPRPFREIMLSKNTGRMQTV